MSGVRDTDSDWIRIAETEPYFGVLSDPRFLSERIDDAAREAFFATGQAYVSDALRRLNQRFDDNTTMRALDFGCGVGRLLVPMARVCETVVGIDVSPAMRALALKNAVDAGLNNVTVYDSLDALPAGTRFDWVNSYIVFQHIHPSRGYALLDALLALLLPGGLLSLHFTIARDRQILPSATNRIKLFRVEGDTIQPMSMTSESAETRMSMFDYDLNILMTTLYRHGFDDINIHHGIDDGHYGVQLFGHRTRIGQGGQLRPGETIRFDVNGATNLLVSGWAAPEEWGVWTMEQTAELDLPIIADKNIVLVFEANGYAPPGGSRQEVTVAINGAQRAVWQAARGEPQSFRLAVDAAEIDRTILRITFSVRRPRAPIESGDGNDFRKLGLGLRSLRIEAA